ncbi:MAG: hypothetical protein A2Y67_00720 [Candidatus Buchananbacteria bacterium RBG_13_39_9]|uniref:Transposase IS200-like domain-containing protein n=1 Tax=Candidatus Buchananbacteria bacterium RBG_13_39_9 TaxID=1797531 RepID=A0A1G1XM59_9BACT|nr:MAG: hypothetical protein A2Y67_00720 [Candidatus Buchananbacteria bacterium RBG_13_39_9]
MLHKPPQKRIYFEGATYFVTCTTHNWVEYFKEPIFCDLFVEILKLAKKIKGFDLYAFVVLLDHFHIMFCPHKAENLPKVMQYIKRHFSRNANFILGYENEEAIGQSLLRLREKYAHLKNEIDHLNNRIFDLRSQFLAKYDANQTQFYKFKWLKSYRDHYIRNSQDFEEHLKYIYNNPMKHKLPDAENYKYIYTNYPDLISEI